MYRIEGSKDGGKWPKGPNFPLIVILFGVAIILCFGVAYLFIPQFAQLIHPIHPNHHPTS